MIVGCCLPGLPLGEVGREHPSHSGVVLYPQAVWGIGGYQQLRIASEVVEEEESLQCQLDSGEGVSYPNRLRECLKGYSRHK